MLKRIRRKIQSDIKRTTANEVMETVVLAMAVLIILAYFGTFD